MSLVLTVDPGLTTGYAWWRTEWDDPDQLPIAGEVKGAVEFIEYVWTHVQDEMHPDVIVCETFRVNAATHQKTQAPWSLEIIGALRWMCWRHGLEFVMQTPADAKAFSTDEKLKKLGWWLPSEGHADDAQRHLLLYLAKTGWDGVQRLVD